MLSSHAVPAKGVLITRSTETDSHPLDRHVDGVRGLREEAFRAVYGAMVDELASFAFGMVSDRRTAEDIVQQSFVELVAAAPRFKGDGRALRAWLYRSVRFGCLDEYRRRARRPEIPVDRLPESPVDAGLGDGHMEPDLELALRALNKRQRTAIVLRHVSGLTGEEIAAVMGSSRRAVYALLARAESKLRDLLGDGDE